MAYVAYHEHKTEAQRAADREADEQWMRDHSAWNTPDPAPATQYGADALAPVMAGAAH